MIEKKRRRLDDARLEYMMMTRYKDDIKREVLYSNFDDKYTRLEQEIAELEAELKELDNGR